MIAFVSDFGPVLMLGGAVLAGVVAVVRGLGAEPPAELNAWPDELWRQL
ncbi:MAG: hypothetical protein K2Y33_04695 [Mycolicibacterium frederiksbergense]|nr:hypothetical protein [Mycolicibacterium frederiksbergense]